MLLCMEVAQHAKRFLEGATEAPECGGFLLRDLVIERGGGTIGPDLGREVAWRPDGHSTLMRAGVFRLRMILSENRCTLFGIMRVRCSVLSRSPRRYADRSVRPSRGRPQRCGPRGRPDIYGNSS